MSTLDDLVRARELIRVPASENRDGLPRRLYATHPFARWAREDLRQIEATFWGGDVPAYDQVTVLFRRFTTGLPLDYHTEFKDLRPVAQGVWELKTGDVRIFGWFPAFDTFVATSGVAKSWLLEDEGVRVAMHMERCVMARGGLDLDEPKFIPAQEARHVMSF